MEDTEQCADCDTLVNQANFLQVPGQTYSHQLQQVRMPQVAKKDKNQFIFFLYKKQKLHLFMYAGG